jgi:hypothetical protein
MKLPENVVPQVRLLPARCGICGKILLVGAFAISPDGRSYCRRHLDEYPLCACCARPVCQPLTGGGATYADGRTVCNVCRRTAIDTKEQGKPVVEGVFSWLHRIGVRFRGLTLRLEILDRKELARRLSVQDAGLTTGVIFKGFVAGPEKARERRVGGIALLSGMPQELFAGSAAHELGHAWLFLNRADGLEPWAEEGFCNLLRYVWHKQQGTDESRFWIKAMEIDPDPVYGEGFRRVKNTFKKHGFGEALTYLHRHRRLPPE